MDDMWTSTLKDTVDSIKKNNNVYTTGKVVKVNDYITLTLGSREITIQVLSLNEKIKKEEAITLYKIIEEKEIKSPIEA